MPLPGVDDPTGAASEAILDSGVSSVCDRDERRGGPCRRGAFFCSLDELRQPRKPACLGVQRPERVAVCGGERRGLPDVGPDLELLAKAHEVGDEVTAILE